MILNIGLALYLGSGRLIDERAEANHAAHFTGVFYDGYDSIQQGYSFMENDARVVELEKINAIGGMGEYTRDGANTASFIMFSRTDDKHRIDAPSLIGESLPLTGDGIYIPNVLFITGGYKLGDDFKLFLSGNEINFTIAGVTEEITFGRVENLMLRMYISDEKYDTLKSLFSSNGLTLLSARLDSKELLTAFQTDYDNTVSINGLYRAVSYDNAKQGYTTILTIIAGIIVALAIVLTIVNLIVIRFRIINDIEEGMTNIGTLKAVGFRSVQIIAANVTQYGLVALAGGIAGVLLAGISIPMITKSFESSIALAWNPGFDMSIAGISMLLVLLPTVITAFLALRGINKLHPLTALRGRGVANAFKKNVFPLDKSFGPLNLHLAFKQIFQNKKQTLSIGIIVAVITMAAVICIAVNDNISFKREAFSYSAFGELAVNDGIFTLKNAEDGEVFVEKLLERPEIRKVVPAHMTGVAHNISFMIDNVRANAYIVDDLSIIESNMITDGRYPKHDNEIMLGTLTAKEMGKKPGDIVNIQVDGIEKEFIVTGIFQIMKTSGRDGLLTTAGIRAFIPDFNYREYIVYLNEGVDTKSFFEDIQSENMNVIDSVLITQEYLGNVLDNMSVMFTLAAAGVVTVTSLVVILTLYMIIKTTILRRRRELGTQKAIGFTTLQLMNQIALNMTPVILLGVLTGAVAGYFAYNPLFVAVMSGMGITKINLPAPLEQIFIVCAALVIMAYAVSMLISWRIRKISAYALVTE
jgi:putative ABC transport system permease protein